jgi:hypothetical protein
VYRNDGAWMERTGVWSLSLMAHHNQRHKTRN